MLEEGLTISKVVWEECLHLSRRWNLCSLLSFGFVCETNFPSNFWLFYLSILSQNFSTYEGTFKLAVRVDIEILYSQSVAGMGSMQCFRATVFLWLPLTDWPALVNVALRLICFRFECKFWKGIFKSGCLCLYAVHVCLTYINAVVFIPLLFGPNHLVAR